MMPDLEALTALRRDLHRKPEISGEETRTAETIRRFLSPTAPDEIVAEMGGAGIAFIYSGSEPGPTVMFRSELDALPIQEKSDAAHRSSIDGKAHLCGHDGHMAILAGLGETIAAKRPRRGRVVLMFQPAEETGAGAAAVIADPRYAARIAPDYAFALHNWPGVPVGAALLQPGVANCASRGLRLELSGKTAHASQPEAGLSPRAALSEIAAFCDGIVARAPAGTVRMATVTHLMLGEPAFGIAPGDGRLFATLRTATNDEMASLIGEVEQKIAEVAGAAGLGVSMAWHDVFSHCINDPDATAILGEALAGQGIEVRSGSFPIRASEDFGRFGETAKSAMVFLGAGETMPALHNPDYDFPDEIIGTGVALFRRVADRLLG